MTTSISYKQLTTTDPTTGDPVRFHVVSILNSDLRWKMLASDLNDSRHEFQDDDLDRYSTSLRDHRDRTLAVAADNWTEYYGDQPLTADIIAGQKLHDAKVLAVVEWTEQLIADKRTAQNTDKIHALTDEGYEAEDIIRFGHDPALVAQLIAT